MRILFICSRGFDYGQDLMYAGLTKTIGKNNITEYPYNIKYHFPLKSYPKNLGYTGLSIRLPIITSFKKFDAVILAAAKPDALSAYQKILPQLKNKPVIFLDGGDNEKIGGDFYRLGAGNMYKELIKQKPFDLIFKREFMDALHAGAGHIFPLPFSFPYNVSFPVREEVEKKYQVAFWGQQYPAIREKALTLLQDKYDCASNGTTLRQDFTTYKRTGLFYLQELSACKIVLNFRGGGWDTMRYWEAPACGSFMISQRPQITIPHNFEDGKHVVWCDDSLTDLIDKIDHYLQRPEERKTIAMNASGHLKRYHLNTNRAEMVLEKIKKII